MQDHDGHTGETRDKLAAAIVDAAQRDLDAIGSNSVPAPIDLCEDNTADAGSKSEGIGIQDEPNPNIESSMEKEAAQRKEAAGRAARRRRRAKIISILDWVSYYGYIGSWIFLAILIVSRIFSLPIISITAVVGSLTCVAGSMIATEVSARVRGVGDGIAGIISIIGAAGFFACGVYGVASSDYEVMSAGVIGIFLWSFFPSVVGFFKSHKWDSVTYDYDEDGNVIGSEGDDEIGMRVPTYRSETISSGFSAINEVFGIPQPVDPPPIEVSKDDMYDDIEEERKWERYLGEDERKDLLVEISPGYDSPLAINIPIPSEDEIPDAFDNAQCPSEPIAEEQSRDGDANVD